MGKGEKWETRESKGTLIYRAKKGELETSGDNIIFGERVMGEEGEK